MTTRRKKICVSAYACSPYQGSESGVGWGFVFALASHHDLWVIVEEEKFHADIERYLAEHPELAQSVHFFFLRKQRNRALRKLWPPSYYWYYRRWHMEALQLAKELHREIGFDLAHQLTMVGFREPGYLWKLGIPFVWGPVGGMGLFPWRFLPAMGPFGALYYLCYNLINMLQMRFLARSRAAGKAAGKALITATPENQMGALKYWGCASTVMTEVGLPCAPAQAIRKRRKNEPFRIVWAGLHVPRKALNLGLRALHQMEGDVDWELHILGSGPCTKSWQRLSQRLGVFGRCRFHGWLPRQQAMEVMGQGHVMLITSLRDLTSTVTVEALAMGLPIISPDHCGFSEVVDDSCGIKVPVTTPKQMVNEMARAIYRLADDEAFRLTLAQEALKRAKEFSWEKKVHTLNQIYLTRVEEGGPTTSCHRHG